MAPIQSRIDSVRPPPLHLCGNSRVHSRTCTAKSEAMSLFTTDDPYHKASTSRDETVIMFDFDDTLCPTSALMADERFLGMSDLDADCPNDISFECREQLRDLQNAAVRALSRASHFGTVVIVTLAKQQWLEHVLSRIMPDLGAAIKSLGIQVVYARDTVQGRLLRHAKEEGVDIPCLMKTKAMSAVLRSFYRGRRGRSWRHIISIGDSDTEKDAILDLAMSRTQFDSYGREDAFRCKVVQLQGDPSVEALTGELELLTDWLELMVLHESDFVIDFEDLARA